MNNAFTKYSCALKDIQLYYKPSQKTITVQIVNFIDQKYYHWNDFFTAT